MKWVHGSTYGSIANQASSFVIKHYGKATVVFDGYEGPSIKDCTHQRRRRTSNYGNVDVTEQRKFVGKKDEFLQSTHNKQQIIRLITEELRQRKCNVIQAEDDADVEIAKAAVTMAQFKSTTVIGEDTDLLVLLLYYTNIDKSYDIYLRSDIIKNNFYDIKTIKDILGKEICQYLLFLHAFTGSDTTSRIYGVGKKAMLQKIINHDRLLTDCAKVFSLPHQSENLISSNGSMAMLAIFNAKKDDTLSSLRYKLLCKKISNSKTFVKPERLPPTTDACKYHSLRVYFQVMVWMGLNGEMDPLDWGWEVQDQKLLPIMTDEVPAPNTLLQMIHCNCSGGCSSLKCTCKKNGIACSIACGQCQNGHCENMSKATICDNDEDDHEVDEELL